MIIPTSNKSKGIKKDYMEKIRFGVGVTYPSTVGDSGENRH